MHKGRLGNVRILTGDSQGTRTNGCLFPSFAYSSAVSRQIGSSQIGRPHTEGTARGSNCGDSRAGMPGTAGVGCSYRSVLTQACLCQGKPKPQASWTHNGHALDSQRVNVRSGDQDSILFIRSAQRADSGRYELTVHLEGLEAKASIDILVIGTRAEGEKAVSKPLCHPPHLPPRNCV